MKRIAWILCVAIASSICFAGNQEADLKLVEVHLNAAVEAKGDDYFALREAVLQYGEAAIPFLQSASGDDRLHARIVARALLAWLQQNVDKQVRIGETARTVVLLARTQDNSDLIQMEQKIRKHHVYEIVAYDLSYVHGVRGDPTELILARANSGAIGEEQQTFLLEAVLKGYPPEWNQALREKNNFARMSAAALSGLSPCGDTATLLVELLNTEEDYRVRMGAARGLELIGDKAFVIPPLIDALSDKNSDIRSVAYRALRELTGEDLAMDPRERTRNVGPLQIESAETWWAENKERVEREQIENPPSREKVKEEPPEPIEQQIERLKRITEEE